MREIVLIVALLARCWKVIARIVSQRCAVPLDVIDELQALDKDLHAFFTSPDTVLGLGIVADQLVEEPTGQAGGHPAVGQTKAVVCDNCGGTGVWKTRYIGVKGDTCHVCRGARMVYPGSPITASERGEIIPIPAWGEEGANWYGKDQRFPPDGYWKACVDLQTSGDQK